MRRSGQVIWLLMALIAAIPVIAVSVRYVYTGTWNTHAASATFLLWMLVGAGAAVHAMWAAA